jgi:hypothetical protein
MRRERTGIDLALRRPRRRKTAHPRAEPPAGDGERRRDEFEPPQARQVERLLGVDHRDAEAALATEIFADDRAEQRGRNGHLQRDEDRGQREREPHFAQRDPAVSAVRVDQLERRRVGRTQAQHRAEQRREEHAERSHDDLWLIAGEYDFQNRADRDDGQTIRCDGDAQQRDLDRGNHHEKTGKHDRGEVAEEPPARRFTQGGRDVGRVERPVLPEFDRDRTRRRQHRVEHGAASDFPDDRDDDERDGTARTRAQQSPHGGEVKARNGHADQPGSNAEASDRDT